jgi:hypothetical protein
MSIDSRSTLTATLLALFTILAGCSSPAPQANGKQTSAPQATTTKIVGNNPLGKYLELGGYRLGEGGSGKLSVKFAVVNHSDADIGDLGMHVKLMTTADKPDDPPFVQFDAKVPGLGPKEVRDASATAETKLKVYEIPDWQFIRAEVEITSPAP